ncbi:MAG: hypothetical protein PHU92_03475 [Candidatus Shapirobacteria bacterium]|nr:hypothetical protein [Candidatus Shapirobacteria bacterium]
MNIINIIGTIRPPAQITSLRAGGMGKFLNNIFILLTVGGGIFALFNFIRAGYTYMSAKDDKEKINDAVAMITNSVIGLLIIASAFVIAALVGKLFFGDWQFIINPRISGPDIPASQV